MKKFHFSLDTLLKVRIARIKVLGSALFERAKECQLLSVEEDLLKQEMQAIEEEISKKRAASNFEWAANDDRYMQHMQDKHLEIKGKKRRAKEELLTLQEKTSKAIVERKIVEKLKEKRYSLWEKEISKDECTNISWKKDHR